MSDVKIEGGATRRVGTIYCIGRSYAEHAAELNNPVPLEPVVFLKASAALRPLASGALAFAGETFHHEAELVLLVGKPIPMGSVPGWDAIEAIGLGLDLTRRDVQNGLKAKGLPWTTAKSFAGSAVVAEFLPREAFGETPEGIKFTLDVNGERRQEGDSRLLLWPMLDMVKYLASLNALEPGDLVFTGTPKGVGPLKRGDKVTLAFTDLAKRYDGVL